MSNNTNVMSLNENRVLASNDDENEFDKPLSEEQGLNTKRGSLAQKSTRTHHRSK